MSAQRRQPRLLGQTVVVIGGSAGIGLETARLARAEGADVVLTGRNEERLEAAAATLGLSRTATFDANDSAALESFFEGLEGPVDHVMVTAGGPYYSRLADMDFDEARRAIQEHPMLMVGVARHALDKVRPGGALVFMGGTGGRNPAVGVGLMSAMTAALPALTASLALEIAPVRINLIAAGFVDTPLSASLLGDGLDERRQQLRETLPIRRVVTPEDVASLAVHLMTNTALTGATYDIDGGQQLLPRTRAALMPHWSRSTSGCPRTCRGADAPCTRGSGRARCRGRAWSRRLNIDGDGQGDLAGHGGEQRAVLVYQLESYRHWQEFLGREDLEHGAFGENFTVDGLADDEVCVGDRYRIGEAEFEVTQPRVTCFRVGMRMGEPRLPSLLVAHHRPGFYLRVMTEGHVTAGDEIVRTRHGPRAMSVADVDALLYLPGHDATRLEAALDIPALSPGWQQSFRSMLESESGTAAPGGVAKAPAPSWPGFRSLTVTDVVTETATVKSFRLAGDEPLPSYAPGQFVTLRLPGEPSLGADLLTVRRPGRRPLPDQREARVARPGQLAAARPASARRPDRGRGATRWIRARLRHDSGAADLGGHRGDAGPRHAAPARGRALHAPGVVDPHDPRRAQPRARRRGQRPAGPAAVGPHLHLLHDAGRAPRARLHRPGGTSHRRGDRPPGPAGRRDRLCVRPRGLHGRHGGRPGPRRPRPWPASTPSGSGRARGSTRASSRATRLRPTSRRVLPAPGRR